MPNTPVRAAAEGLPKNMTAEERLKFHAAQFAKAAQEIEPAATVWWMGRCVGDEALGRFTLIGSWKEV